MSHECFNCGMECDYDMDDTGGMPQPDDCRCPCFDEDDCWDEETA